MLIVAETATAASGSGGCAMNKAKDNQVLENYVLMLLYCMQTIARVCWAGLKNMSWEMWFFVVMMAGFLGMLMFYDINHVHRFIYWLFTDSYPFYLRLFLGMQVSNQYLLLTGIFLVFFLFFCGFKPFRRHVIFQKAIERAGLKTATGENPKIKAIVPMGECRLKVVVETYGVGLNKFQAQKDSLTAGFRQKVEDIVYGKDMGKVEIILCERDLPNMVSFSELYAHIKEPYSFIVGQSINGAVTQRIQSLPHLLISGATGGGKSVFFRSTMLSLLKSSPHIQLYLLDLKRGVEVKEFAALPNVKTAADETEATHMLEALVAEMHRRYEILEQNGHKSIDPKRDKLDLIVVGIDEAAALLGKITNETARNCMSELARLARAAGIHLIPATQKPVKEAISTEILDNLSGRMTFRMISSAASNVAMGGNYAQKLPAIKGRAMWCNGSERRQVQAPYVDDELIETELEVISQEFRDGIRQNFNSLLGETFNVKISQAKKHA